MDDELRADFRYIWACLSGMAIPVWVVFGWGGALIALAVAPVLAWLLTRLIVFFTTDRNADPRPCLTCGDLTYQASGYCPEHDHVDPVVGTDRPID